MRQQQVVVECVLTFDAKKNREYFVGKLSCGCPFRKLVTAGASPPMRMACDHHPQKVEVPPAPFAMSPGHQEVIPKSPIPEGEQRSDPLALPTNAPTSPNPDAICAKSVPSNPSPTPERPTTMPTGTVGTAPKAGEFVPLSNNEEAIVFPTTKIPGHEPVMEPLPSAELQDKIDYVVMTDDEPTVLAAELPPVSVTIVAAPQPSESVTASAPVDPTEYDPVTGKMILDTKVLNRYFGKRYPDKKPY